MNPPNVDLIDAYIDNLEKQREDVQVVATQIGHRVVDAVLDHQSGPGDILHVAATEVLDIVRSLYGTLRLDASALPDWCGDCAALREHGYDDCVECTVTP